MISITSAKSPKNNSKAHRIKIWAVVFWLLVWQAASIQIGQDILLVSPLSVLVRLGDLVFTADYWYSIYFSLIRIGAGFLLAVAAGTLLAGFGARFMRVYQLLNPLMLAIKATPVASFSILVLIWLPSRNLSVFIALLMVLPIVYTNVLDGIQNTDTRLLEMAKVFRIPALRRIRFIYIPQIMPFFRAACTVSLGLCWKAGVAAEVIGIPKGSIGEKLYEAKIYLSTPDLFAWTLTIILISLLFEKVFLLLLRGAAHRLERM